MSLQELEDKPLIIINEEIERVEGTDIYINSDEFQLIESLKNNGIFSLKYKNKIIPIRYHTKGYWYAVTTQVNKKARTTIGDKLNKTTLTSLVNSF